MSHPPRGAWIEIRKGRKGSPGSKSHPPRGAWIEIGIMAISVGIAARRTPHGVRGLKSCFPPYDKSPVSSHPPRGAWIEIVPAVIRYKAVLSHPPRGAWIEIPVPRQATQSIKCRTPHGVRGLKSLQVQMMEITARRTPHGVRGLKLYEIHKPKVLQLSHPPRGAWIEISCGVSPLPLCL